MKRSLQLIAGLVGLTTTFDAHAGAGIMKRVHTGQRSGAALSPRAPGPPAPLAPAAAPEPTSLPAPVVAPHSAAAPPVPLGSPDGPVSSAPEALLQASASEAAPAPPSAPAAVTETSPVSRDEGAEPFPNDADDSEPLEPGVGVRASTGIVRRSLRFYQDVYDRLRALDANLYVYRFDASVYPAFENRFLDGHVALVAGFEGTYAGSVRDDDFGGEYAISYSELFAGLRVRRQVQRHVLGFELSVGRLAAGLDDGARAGTPDVRYGNVRAALDLGTRLGPLSTTLAAGFRVPLGYGELAADEWFPRVGGYGVEAQASAAYPLSRLVALEASASLRRFVLEMNSEPEDGDGGVSEVAGGAVDSFLALYAGVRLSL